MPPKKKKKAAAASDAAAAKPNDDVKSVQDMGLDSVKSMVTLSGRLCAAAPHRTGRDTT